MVKFAAQCLACVILWTGVQARGESVPLQNLNRSEFSTVIRAFSSAFSFTSATPASSLEPHHLNVGLVFGFASTDGLNPLVREVRQDLRADRLPNAELIAAMTFSYGITAEIGFTPRIGSPDFKYSKYSFAGKWTATDFFLQWPVNLAVKGIFNRSELRSLANDTRYDYRGVIYGGSVLLSKSLDVFEPYVALGLLRGQGEMAGQGAATVYEPSYTGQSTSREAVIDLTWAFGLEVTVLLTRLGFEYQALFEGSRFTLKVSHGF